MLCIFTIVSSEGRIIMKKLTAVVLGYGIRGQTYAKYAKQFPEELEIVAIADPVDIKREQGQELFGLADENVFKHWKEITDKPKMADFAIIATQDHMHYEPALACIEKGYDLLLEKPMAPTARECKEIAEAAEKKGVKVIVCHVLRFTEFYKKVKDIIDDGTLGEIVSMECKECVGNIHQSHSFVRGNWRNKEESAPMILAKSCHDTDLIQWLLGKECKKIQSFGSLSHFNAANRPEGAPDFCIQGCPHGDTCYYNAVKLYLDDKDNLWFRGAATDNMIDPSDEEVEAAITTGPYGRCVYACDNNVVDHQVLNMEFEGGCTVSFSMNAFNKGGRTIHIFGTKGELTGSIDTGVIEIYSFATKDYTKVDVNNTGNSITAGHGGGDTGIMIDLVKYFGDENQSKSICSIRTSYINHLISFAAEDARIDETTIYLDEYEKNV